MIFLSAATASRWPSQPVETTEIEADDELTLQSKSSG